MANIIEQQDLLKGIPDARLSLLLKSPDASIPPFLVAAEAQRRQAIRQQFAGSGTNESVVDTLTKQLANVPQNIQAPRQTPPQMPPPQMQPQMAGIGALPQAQQQMAGGGPVRRFAPGGYVEPMWKIPDYSGVIPRVGDWVGGKTKELYDYATTPWGDTEAPANPADSSGIDLSLPDIKIPNSNPNFADNGEPSPYTDLTPKPKKPPSSTTGTDDTSAENKYKAMEADMRNRLEGLYEDEGASNWENAQKWFAVSQQIMNPDATLMQGLINAGSAYAEIAGNQAADQRQSDRAREEALLNYDLQIMQGDRASEAAAAAKAEERAFELQKGQQLRPSDAIGALGDLIKGIDKKLEDSGMMLDDAAKQSLMRERQMYEMQLASIMKSGGYGTSGVITRDQLSQ